MTEQCFSEKEIRQLQRKHRTGVSRQRDAVVLANANCGTKPPRGANSFERLDWCRDWTDNYLSRLDH